MHCNDALQIWPLPLFCAGLGVSKPCTPAPSSMTASPPLPPHKPCAEVRHSFFALPRAGGQPSKADAIGGATGPALPQQAAHAQHEASPQAEAGPSASREEESSSFGGAEQPLSKQSERADCPGPSGAAQQQRTSATSPAAGAAHSLGLQTGLSLLDTQNLDDFAGLGDASQAQAGRLPAFHTAMSMLSTMGSVGTFAGPIAPPAWDSDEDGSHRGSASDDVTSDAALSSNSDDIDITFGSIHASSRPAASQLGSQVSAAAQAKHSMHTASRLAQEAREAQARIAGAALEAGRQQREASAAMGTADTRPVFMKALQILHSGRPAEQPAEAAGHTSPHVSAPEHTTTVNSSVFGLQPAIAEVPSAAPPPAAAQRADAGPLREQHVDAPEDKAALKVMSTTVEASGRNSDTMQDPAIWQPSAEPAGAAAVAGHSHAAGLHIQPWNAKTDPGQPGVRSSGASQGARRALKGPSRLSAAAKPFIPGQPPASLGPARAGGATYGNTAEHMGPPAAQSRSSLAQGLPQTDAAQEKALPALSAGSNRPQALGDSGLRSASPLAAEAKPGSSQAGLGPAFGTADSAFRAASRFAAEAGAGHRHASASQTAGPASSSSVAPSMPTTNPSVSKLPASSRSPAASADSLPPAAGRPAPEMQASHGRAGLGTPASEALPGTLSNAEDLVKDGGVISTEAAPSHNPCQRLDFGQSASKVSLSSICFAKLCMHCMLACPKQCIPSTR